ncbi:MAG: hypothetical protein ACK4PC_09845, partial [Sphingopyxis sp.]
MAHADRRSFIHRMAGRPLPLLLSITALSLMRLIPDPPGRIVAGKVVLEGTDLLTLSEPEMRQIRGNRVSMIFQEPMTSLNPVLTVGRQISQALMM